MWEQNYSIRIIYKLTTIHNNQVEHAHSVNKGAATKETINIMKITYILEGFWGSLSLQVSLRTHFAVIKVWNSKQYKIFIFKINNLYSCLYIFCKCSNEGREWLFSSSKRIQTKHSSLFYSLVIWHRVWWLSNLSVDFPQRIDCDYHRI